MTTPTHAWLSRYAAAWSTQDVPAILDFFTDDPRFEDIPLGLKAETRSELRAILEFTFESVPDFRMEILEHHDGGHFIVTRWRQSGTMTAESHGLRLDAVPCAVETTSIITRSSDGRITGLADNWNAGIFTQGAQTA